MSQRQKENVSKIVEKYKNKYPRTQREALRELILSKFTQFNPRTLDRHLKKAFENEPSGKESASEDHDELSQILKVFQEVPRDPFFCSLAIDRVKNEYPEYYRRNKKVFAEMKMMNYGFGGWITNPQPRKHKINQKDETMREDDN